MTERAFKDLQAMVSSSNFCVLCTQTLHYKRGEKAVFNSMPVRIGVQAFTLGIGLVFL